MQLRSLRRLKTRIKFQQQDQSDFLTQSIFLLIQSVLPTIFHFVTLDIKLNINAFKLQKLIDAA
jgi:hypothetical protein